MTSKTLSICIVAAVLSAGCSSQLWGPEAGGGGEFGTFNPNDPSNTNTAFEDDQTEDSPNFRGWLYMMSGAETAIYVNEYGFIPVQYAVEIILNKGGFTFDFDWDVEGTYTPIKRTDAESSSITTKLHVCENNSISLTITDSDGKIVTRDLRVHPRNEDACDTICDGSISNCPFNPDLSPPPSDCSELISGNVSLPTNPCEEQCVNNAIACAERNNCTFTSSCQSSYTNCIVGCVSAN